MNDEPRQHSYANNHIRVSFDGGKCAHAGFCFKELHAVFDGDSNPPINLDGGSTEEVIRVVEMCPSSALIYERLDGEANELPSAQVTATIIPNGPLALRGELRLGDQTYSRLTLCRCGKSLRKPLCDGSHHQHQFDDGAEIPAEQTDSAVQPGSINLNPFPNGPVGFSGDITVENANGDVICRRTKGGLCRCGSSKTKPFCDGAHSKIGFEA